MISVLRDMYLFSAGSTNKSSILRTTYQNYGKCCEQGNRRANALRKYYFNDRAIGITSDFDGKYSIETKNPPGDSLIATFIGFEKEIIIVEKGKFQIINLK